MTPLASGRRLQRLLLLVVFFLVFAYLSYPSLSRSQGWQDASEPDEEYIPTSFDWASRPMKNPIPESSLVQLPKGPPRELPRIQYAFTADELGKAHNETQWYRRDAVRKAAQKSWKSYRAFAWRHDELTPQSLTGKDSFAGWGATLVDSLDTLWIMGLREEFDEAVRAVGAIDWNKSSSSHCSLFETNIRYLGGLISAYDLSNREILFKKAVELGDMLFAGFDTPNHLPANSYDFRKAKVGELSASSRQSLAVLGSMSMEFTRLSQLTGDPKYYSIVEQLKKGLEKTQEQTNLPGLWPKYIDLIEGTRPRSDTLFTLGAQADSAYEYLSKTYLLLGGLDPSYELMHVKAMDAAVKHLLFRPMLPSGDDDTYEAGSPPPDILFSGNAVSTQRDKSDLQPRVQHLGCFAGGMFALGGKLFDRPDHVQIGEQLARGCAWAYEAFSTGIMPEVSELVPCDKVVEHEAEENDDHLAQCPWNEAKWRQRKKKAAAAAAAAAAMNTRFASDTTNSQTTTLPKPFTKLLDPHYLLRPEAIESLFVLYRITGKKDLLDIAWRMFQSITKATETKFAFSAIEDVHIPNPGQPTTKTDSMESFWMAETLKYFYLIFSPEDGAAEGSGGEEEGVTLDGWVFNTEAHPFRVPRPMVEVKVREGGEGEEKSK
ncbi:glycoside hydrolase family 47 protein [Neurospora crassa]|uniref:alpha-1,2-Mannosidase n=2 Tax=Neurospora crassa TaxID=5141 RepID=Q7SDV6_NEUCR|nr:class I alpha-mannosidase 1A [Neurospora crassa OR74A]EAA34947.3 class I alpha-mannosidase 1A [Neurospora crassa OR74A]KHE85985.1 glycoside hydrolase family 47 protein [Neurospora crassa]CAE76560.1 related to alpha-mannosidase 1a [Neurospora crassa]|eukprot:XP_964183.3 class I alpha-mannosidase 1A [Neurospora crassa OR74A]